MEELLTSANVRRLWGKTPAADKVYAAQERQAHVARVRSEIDAGTYETPEKLDVAVGKLVDLMNKPDLAEVERAEFDRLNDGERFDGLS